MWLIKVILGETGIIKEGHTNKLNSVLFNIEFYVYKLIDKVVHNSPNFSGGSLGKLTVQSIKLLENLCEVIVFQCTVLAMNSRVWSWNKSEYNNVDETQWTILCPFNDFENQKQPDVTRSQPCPL